MILYVLESIFVDKYINCLARKADMFLIDYKLLYKFQKKSLRHINNNSDSSIKLEKICELLEEYIPQSQFKIVNKKLKFKKVLLTNEYNSALIRYVNDLIDIVINVKTLQDEIDFITYHDLLTGLKNKSSLQKILKTDMKASKLLLLNVDNFSYVNTAYGSDSGDIILIKIANMLQSMCSDEFLYRIGSDEFGIVYKKDIDIVQKIQKIQKYFSKNPIVVDDFTFYVSFTYGGAIGENALFEKATIALKEAKQRGNKIYKVYNKDESVIKNSQITDFIHWNHIIHDALKNSKLVPFFQGIYSEKESKISTYEVLARIKHKDGFYLPHEFLETAKLSGMLVKITKVMISKSFAFMSKESCRFSINITEQDLEQNFLLKYLNKYAQKYNVAKSRVTLEILEDISSYSGKNHVLQLLDLKKAGYKIAIDDFGTQYSNFERLLDLNIDYIKLDAKYIKHIDKDEKSQDIVKSITMFAKKNNIPCIAEYVHNKQVAKKVKSMGIQYSQGYYYSKPNLKI